MKGNRMNNDQLELGLKQTVLRITVRRRPSRRAHWWFEQMRYAVDSAIDWRPGTPDGSEQLRLLPGRDPSMA